MNLLQDAVDLGIIDLATVRFEVEQMKKKQYLKMHKNSIWGSKGYWYTYIGEGKSRKLIKKKDRKDLEEVIIEYYRDDEPTFEQVFTEWSTLKRDRGEIQPQSFDRYMTDYKRFLEDFGKRKIKDITEDDLYSFIADTIHEYNLTAKAWSGLRTILVGVFKNAKRRHLTEISISSFMGDLDISRNAFKKRRFSDEESVFNSEEMELLRKRIEQEEPSLLNIGVLLIAETGLRCGELSALEYSDMQGNVLNVAKTEVHFKTDKGYEYDVRESTKGKYGARKVVLTARAIELIEKAHELNPNGHYLFEVDGRRLRGKNFNAKITRLCTTVGIPQRSIHKMRKTYISRLANAGIPQKVICSQVGHTDFKTTDTYYWFNNKTVSEVEEMLNRVE